MVSTIIWSFSRQKASFWWELQVSKGPRPHLSICACKTGWLAPELIVSMRPRPYLSLCACKTAWLASEILVSIGPRPHLWFWRSKTSWLASELLVSIIPPRIYGFCMQNSAFRTRITSLYGSQTSSEVFKCRTTASGPELQVSMGPRPYLCFLCI